MQYLFAAMILTSLLGWETTSQMAKQAIANDRDTAISEANALSEVVTAAAAWIVQQGATVPDSTYSDVSFLQEPSCGGTASQEYLPCTWIEPVKTGVSFNFSVLNNAGSPSMTIDFGVPVQNVADYPSGVKAATMMTQIEKTLQTSPFTFIKLEVTADEHLVATLDTTQGNDPYIRIDGTNSMLASFDMGGNDIVNAGAVNAASAAISGDVTVGTLVSTGQIEGSTLKPNLIVSETDPCTQNGAIAQDATGKTLSCQSGSWTGGGSGGSTVITGFIGNGQVVPLPLGFSASQCSMSVSASNIYNGGNTWEYNGGLASLNTSSRVATCIKRIANVNYGATCSYIVSCN